MVEHIEQWLVNIGISENLALYLRWISLGLAMIIVAYLSDYLAKRFLLAGVSRVVKKTRTNWDDSLLRRKVFTRLAHIAPALVIYFSSHLFPPLQEILQRLSVVYMILVGLSVINSTLNAVNDIYRTFSISRQRPIKGYLQIAKIIITIFIVIIAISTLMDRSPWLILSGLGAMTAILLLIFKDSILGLVASVQLSSNDMVRIGDWIEMPKYGADGDVIDVTLHTVKVQNWDKTITSIPSYSLISDSFKNWRGMSESGGRRIKRSINIDMSSVKFCTNEMLDRFEKYQLIKEYIQIKRKELAEYNKENTIDTSELINGRNLTNLGTFRAYLVAYLHNRPDVHKEMTFLIRHLPPGSNGIPIEIYIFSTDQVWANYEAIQADIFDHILAVLPMFDLSVFQYPTGGDLQGMIAKSS
jgi:miniconductance mechanosensitive channel